LLADFFVLFSQVTATDLDSGINGEITYNISSGNDYGHFMINSSTGIISVSRRLDREMVGFLSNSFPLIFLSRKVELRYEEYGYFSRPFLNGMRRFPRTR
jgi:hypothetical protein